MNIPNGYGLVQHFFTGTGVPLGAAVTYGIANAALTTPAAAAETLHGIWGTRMMTNIASSCVLSTTRVKMGPNEDGPFAEFTDPIPGSSASAATSPNVAYLLEKRTAIGGRQGQGRCYQPGVREDTVDQAGVLSNTVIDAINIDLSDILADMDAANLPMFLLHSNALAPTEVTSMVCDTRAATQRRRLRR